MTTTTCDCPNCDCSVEAGAIQRDGKSFCSQACASGHADGKGCGHHGCDCG